LQAALPGNCICTSASYDQAPELLAELQWAGVHGILLDLGLSSDQLADANRGFSFQSSGELDMRFDPTQGQPVWQWLNQASERDIANTIFQYGEERYSRRIAKRIVEFRRSALLKTAEQLRDIVHRAVPRSLPRGRSSASKQARKLDPATRTFQALRIAVNEELLILARGLERLVDCLLPGGTLLVISFHSLEDRLVKNAMRGDPRLEVITKKPVQAQAMEIANNPRARSAKLRAARRRADTFDTSP
jgi:16S rRNA (cytosine1402-N4)-methyltransferase